jgi:hypothetical protein
MNAIFTPSRRTSPWKPDLMMKPTAASQSPFVGNELNWHGHPKLQLQFAISSASISQGVMTSLPQRSE